jgi:hypothetical protein
VFVTVYDIIALPLETPVTEPVELTVAIAVLALLQTPPVVASVSVIEAPGQTEEGPEIADGAVGGPRTVIVYPVVAVPQIPV